LVLQRFSGLFGFTFEGFWFRDQANQIHAQADPRAPGEWPTHDPLDWLHKAGAAEGIRWNTFANVGEFDLIAVDLVQPGEVLPDNLDLAPLGVRNSFVVDLPTWLLGLPACLQRWYLAYVARRHVCITDEWLSNSLTNWLAGRPRTSWNYRALCDQARTMVSRQYPRWDTLPRSTDILTLHVDVAWVSTLLDHAASATYVQRVTSPYLPQINGLLQHMDVPDTNPVLSLMQMGGGRFWAAFLTGLYVVWSCRHSLLSFAARRVLAPGFLRLPSSAQVRAAFPDVAPFLERCSAAMLNFAAMLPTRDWRFWAPITIVPFYEEGLKALTGKYGWIVLESLLNHKVLIHPQVFLCHSVVGAGRTYFERVLIHLVWNLIAVLTVALKPGGVVAPGTMRWWDVLHKIWTVMCKFLRPTRIRTPSVAKPEWVERFGYARLMFPSPTYADSEYEIIPFPADQRMMPCQHVPNVGTVATCPFLSVQGSLDTVRMDNSVFAVINPHNVPFLVPAGDPELLLAAITARLLSPPPLAPLEQAKMWAKVPPITELPLPTLCYNEYYNAWKSTFDARKRARLVQAETRIHESSLLVQPTVMFLKRDEALQKTSGRFKPRVICNVAPEVQVALGPYIAGAYHRLHQLWDISPNNVGPGLSVTFGCGLTDLELDSWMLAVQSHLESTWIIVAGDDSVVCWKGRWFACDATAFDQSQSFGPLRWEHKQLALLGVPGAAIQVLKKSCASRLVTRHRKSVQQLEIDRRHRWMRDTGGPDTSLGNSLCMAAGWCEAVRRLPANVDHATLKDFFLTQLGFDMKISELPVNKVSFLKGCWVPSLLGEMHWVPLPSRYLKFGKALRDPCQIYHISDPVAAAAYHYRCIASSYRTYQNVPLIGCFVRRWLQEGDYPNVLHPYKPQHVREVDNTPTSELYEFFAEYYSVDASMFLSLESIIGVLPLFAYVGHPLLRVLAEHDYD
jgi:hypothetical protein